MPTHENPRAKSVLSRLALTLGLCTPVLAQAQAAAEPPEAAEAAEPARDVCPMRIPRTQLVSRDFENGTALLFITPDYLASAVQDRVEALAERHNRQATSSGEGAMPAVASMQRLERGAALTFTWVDVGEPRAVASEVLVYTQQLAGSDCPILRDTGSETEQATKPMSPAQAPMPGATVPGVSSGVSGPPIGGQPPTISW